MGGGHQLHRPGRRLVQPSDVARAARRPRRSEISLDGHARRSLALILVALVACTSSGGGDRPSPSADGDTSAEGSLTGEIVDQIRETQERLQALEDAIRRGEVGIIGGRANVPPPGWVGERILDRRGNDWEPAIAADPNAPYVYVVHNRYGGRAACGGCPDPALIIHVSDDDGQTWGPERFLCVCRGARGQFDPLIEVVAQTGDVVAAWMNGFHIRFSRSSDHGATWSDDVNVQGHVGWGDKPNLAVSPDGQDVYLQFNGPTDGDVWAASSHDGGTTWTQTRVTHGDRYFYDYSGAVLPSGRVVFAQISFANGGSASEEIHTILSDDGGATWAVHLVDTLRPGSQCTSPKCPPDFDDSGPVLAVDALGHLVIVYSGARRDHGPRSVFARSSTDGGLTWSDRVRLSEPGVNATFAAAVGAGPGEARAWFADERTGRWNVWYTRTTDLGATWSEPIRISDARSGTAYKSERGFAEFYGDYGEIAVTDVGTTVATWGEGSSYAGPGGVWFNRER